MPKSLADYYFGTKKKGKRKPITRGTLRDVYQRAGGECERCGESLRGMKGHMHHKNRKKSDNRKANLILLCANCHTRAHDRDKPKKKKKKANPLGLPKLRGRLI